MNPIEKLDFLLTYMDYYVNMWTYHHRDTATHPIHTLEYAFQNKGSNRYDIFAGRSAEFIQVQWWNKNAVLTIHGSSNASFPSVIAKRTYDIHRGVCYNYSAWETYPIQADKIGTKSVHDTTNRL